MKGIREMFNTLLNAETAQISEALGVVWNTVVNWAMNTGIKILIAVILLIVSFKVINAVSKKIEKKGNDERFDKTLMRTLSYITKIGLKVVIVICLVGYLGIDTSGLTALVASFGVCFGLAVNGAVANVAGGVLILFTRPFKVDDFIEAQGVSGTVEDIHMVSTKIRTGDNKIIYVPNGALANGNIINYSEKDTRRLDMTFSVAYSSDLDKAKSIIQGLVDSNELVLKTPAPFIRVNEYAASSVDIVCRVWTNSGDYWTVRYDLLEQVKAEFDKAGIEIPFDQIDVHVRND